jgi:hypothetical protein
MRDYRSEYKNYHSKPEQKKNRASRNLARRIMKKKLGVSINGKDIDHKDGNPRNNSRSNLRVQNKSKNRSRNA